ncbi:MAG: TDP-N-acetylfucosamine:lipid II N-acetylfucosaminyltransferase [Bacteroidales bacterium]|nr:TDP-N-acetylfucosamine:lipid II N-acetylfucosaminyltransferase [Bacteroidales bacterium]
MTRQAKILHIFDDEKITKDSIELFNEIAGFSQNHIIISSNPEKAQINYNDIENVTILNQNDKLEKILYNAIRDNDIIFLQALSYLKAKILAKYKYQNKTFVWGLWGYDLYNYITYKTKPKFLTKGIREGIRDYYTYNIIYKRAFKKIDYCLFLLEQDYNLLKSNAKTNAKWISNCYQTIEQINNQCPNFKVSGTAILTGNSSTTSNKHEIIFNKIAGLNDRKIICPLNYGDVNYQKKVVGSGVEFFGENFYPLIDFMELKDYLKLLEECSITIMAHERQQAFGTIIQMLYGGSKVFLSKKSPLYKYFLINGFAINSVEDDLNIDTIKPLQDKYKKNNRNKALELYSKAKIIETQKNILEKLQQDFNE